MHWTHPRQTFPRTLVGWRAMWIGLGLLLTAWPAMVLGQGGPPAQMGQSAPDGEEPLWLSDRFSGQSGQSLGMLFRAGAVVGEGVGREETFFPVELMPYFFLEDGVILADARGFRGASDRWGFNAGVGYRHYVSAWDRIFGINAFYDSDDLSGAVFRQYGVGLETLGPAWDMRLNTYFPTGRDKTNLQGPDVLVDTLKYRDNRILFDQLRIEGTAMMGVDHEIGVPLPGRFLRQHDVRGFAGWYHFQNDALRTWGWRGRLQGDLTPNLQLGLDVTNDTLYDTNVFMTVAFQYGGYRQPEDRPRNQFDRMTTPILRNYHVVVAKTEVIDKDLVALKANGDPYFVEHVANDPANPNLPPYVGTVENPFLTIAQAQNPLTAPGGDIIFVHTNSEYSGLNIVTEPGVRILGEADGVEHTFFLANLGQTVPLPRANNAPDDANDPNFVVERRPLFRDIPGDGVTLASGFSDRIRTEFSGFRLGVAEQGDEQSGTQRDGIVGNNVQFVSVRLNDVTFAGRDGVSLSNIETQQLNSVFFEGNRILNAARHGLNFFDSTGDATFRGDPDFQADRDVAANVVREGGTNAFLDIPFTEATLAFDPALGTRDNPDPVNLSDTVDPGVNTGVLAGNAVLIEDTGPESNLRMGGGSVSAGSPKPAVIVYGNLLELSDPLDVNSERLGPELPALAGGIVVNNAQGSATFGLTRIGNTRPGTAGIDILNSSGNYLFTDFFQGTTRRPDDRPEVVINRADQEGIIINNLLAGGSVTFDGSVHVIDRRSHGVNLQDNIGDVSFNELLRIVPRGLSLDDTATYTSFDTFAAGFDADRDPTLTTVPTPDPAIDYSITTTLPGIEYQQSSGNVSFRDVQIVSGEGSGILIGELGNVLGQGNTGAFQITNSVDIVDMDDISLLIQSDDSTVTIANLSIANRGDAVDPASIGNDQGIVIRGNRGDVGFDFVTIGNEEAILNAAIEILGNSGDISFSNITTINDALGDPTRITPVAGVAISPQITNLLPFTARQSGNVLFDELNINNAADGFGLFAREVGSLFEDNTLVGSGTQTPAGLTIGGGNVLVNDYDAIDIAYSNINVLFNSVSSFDPVRNGVRLVNNVQFSIFGSNTAFAIVPDDPTFLPGDGGIISDAPEDGIFIANSGIITIAGVQITDGAEEGIDQRVEVRLALPDTIPNALTPFNNDETELESLIGLNDYIDPTLLVAVALEQLPNLFTVYAENDSLSISNSVIRGDIPHSLLVQRSIIQDNGESGIQTIGVPDVTVEDTQLLDNGSLATVGTNPLSSPSLPQGLRQDFVIAPNQGTRAASTGGSRAANPIPDGLTQVANGFDDFVFDDDDPQILMFATDLVDPATNLQPVYNWTLQRNEFSQTAPFSAVEAYAATGARNLTLNFFMGGLPTTATQRAFTNVTMQSGTGDDVAGVDIRWNGLLNATVRDSQFLLLDDTFILQSAIRMTNNAFDNTIGFNNVILIQDNNIEVNGPLFAENFGQVGDVFGIDLLFVGTSSIVIQGTTNQIPAQITEPGLFQRLFFTGNNAQAIRMDLRQGSQTFINQNFIQMLGEGGDGIVYRRIVEPSTAVINGNFIQSSQGFIGFFDDLGERGIVFETVNGTIGLQGTVNNQVILENLQQSNQPWFIFNGNPPIGQIIVNGVAVP